MHGDIKWKFYVIIGYLGVFIVKIIGKISLSE